MAALGEELEESEARVLDPEAMQIELEAWLDVPTLQCQQDPFLHAGPCEQQVIMGLDLRFGQRGAVVSVVLRRSRTWDRRRPLAIRLDGIVPQRFSILDLRPKQFIIRVL
jgi:hypothetical protein